MGVQRSAFLDLVRLELAALVIFSHGFELLTGAEPGFLSASTGSWAVRGFFFLSGYLITASWSAKPDLANFARRRFLRIVPGFAVAFGVSVLIVAPIGGVLALPVNLWADLFTLSAPHVPAFAGSLVQSVNQPMWTIRWELLCYALVPVLYPILSRPILLSVALVGGLAATVAGWGMQTPIVSMLFAFLVGSALSGFRLPTIRTFRLPDVSYGVYLYGWPIQKILVAAGVRDGWSLFALALPISLVLGYASHRLVERPAVSWGRRMLASPAPAAT